MTRCDWRRLILSFAAALVLVFGLRAWSGAPGIGPAEARSPQAVSVPKPAQWPGPFRVSIEHVRDGDSVDVRFEEGPCGRGPCSGSEWTLRIRGIDTAETSRCRGRPRQSCAACEAEVKAGRQAAAHARRLLDGAVAARVRELGPDPYQGRIVGTLEILRGGGWVSYGALMMEAGLAVPYDPAARGSWEKTKPWCRRAG